jgi:hypothetical protein
MIKLSKSAYRRAYRSYLDRKAFFPLIGAVLLRDQEGSVFGDHPTSPTQVFVEHDFGFAQIFGPPTPCLDDWLRRYLLIDKGFTAAKLRLYTPYLPGFLNSAACGPLRSFRQRFTLARDNNLSASVTPREFTRGMRLVDVGHGNIDDVERVFHVVNRFWRSPDDFVNKAHPVVVMMNDKPAAICYAAAVANNCAEVDVLTLPECRRMGAAKLAVVVFIKRCLDSGLQPVWDCFTNNIGSMALCRSSGFVPASDAYAFFTIAK